MNANECQAVQQDVFENGKWYWNAETTKLLIEQVRDHISCLNNKNYIQKKVWKDIASNFRKRGYNVNYEQCCTKWKNLQQKYKHVRDMNNKTGNGRENWEYFDMMDEFLNTRPEVLPVSIASSSHGFRIMKRSSCTNMESDDNSNENDSSVPNVSHDTTRNIKKRKVQTESTLLDKIFKQRQQHHQEKIEMQEKFLKLFERYVEKDNV